MKKIALILAVLAVAYCAASYFVGRQAEAVLNTRLEQMKTDAPGVNCTLKEKRQGIFTSRYTYTLAFNVPGEPGGPASGKPITLDAILDVSHGPVAFAGGPAVCLALTDTTFAANQDTPQIPRDFLAKLPELAQTTLRTRIAFDGSGATSIAVPPAKRTVQLENGTALQVEWQPLEATATFNADFTESEMTGRCPLIRLGDGKASATFAGFSFTSKARRITGKIWGGSYRVALESFDVQPAAPDTPVHLDKLYANLDLKPRGGLLDYAAEFGGTGRNQTGTVIPATMSLAVANLDVAALDELQNILQKQATPGALPQSPAQEDLLRVGNALLARSPRLDLSLKALEGDLGPVTLQASVNTDNMKQVPANAALIPSMLRATAKLDGPAKGVLELACLLVQNKTKRPSSDPALRQEMAVQLDQLVLQGILVPSEDRLASVADWDGVGLTVNGKRLQ